MSLYVNARSILDKVQMTNPIEVLLDEPIISYDPFLPANNVESTATTMTQFVQGDGGFDDVSRYEWITTLDVPIGTKLKFDSKIWTIVGKDNYQATGFTDAIIYKAQEADSTQRKEADNGKWQ